MSEYFDLKSPDDIVVPESPPFNHPSQIHGDWERIPIVSSATLRRLDELGYDREGNLQAALLPPNEVESLSELQSMVAAYVGGINYDLQDLAHKKTNMSYELIDFASDLLVGKNSDNLLHYYARHRAMLEFLKSLRLLSNYYNGDIVDSIRTNKHRRRGVALDEEDLRSWAVSIGYLPKSRQNGPDSIFLTSEFLYGEDMNGFRHTLVATKFPRRMSHDELVELGLAA